MRLIHWHKALLRLFQDRLGISEYGMGWIAFIEGLVIGVACLSSSTGVIRYATKGH